MTPYTKLLTSVFICFLLLNNVLANAAGKNTVGDQKPAGLKGLIVERVLLKPGGHEGGVVEVLYRIVGIKALPSDPSETYLENSETGALSRVKETPHIRILTPEEVVSTKPDRFAVSNHDDKRFHAGDRVSVIVAGLRQDNLLIEDPAILSPFSKPLHPDAGLKVAHAKLLPGDSKDTIEVGYRIFGIEELPEDPEQTYLLDPSSGRKVYISKIPMIRTPAPIGATDVPLSYLIFQAPRNTFTEEQQISVIVCGLRANDVPVTAADESITTAAINSQQKASAVGEGQATTEPPRLEIVRLQVTGGGDLLDVRYRMFGIRRLPPDQSQTYILNPATGKKHHVLGLTRIGLLSTKNIDKGRSAFLLVQNPQKAIKPGDKVTVVIAGVKQENVLVEE